MKKYIPITLVSFLALIVWLPLWMLISGSLMPIDEIKAYFGPVLLGSSGIAKWPLIPDYPTLRPYVELLLDSPEFFAMFWNSIKIVVPVLIGQVCFGMPAAWAFARFKFPCKKFLFTLYIALMLMPFQVTMVPNYLVLDQMNLLNTREGIILPLVFSTFPVFIMYRFFSSIPETMIEAIKIDGAGHFRAFLHIGLPLGTPGIISALVLGFLEYWNMIEQPLTFIQDKSLWPLSLYLPQIAVDQLSVSIVASVMMLIPALLVFLWGQNDLEAGIRVAGLKE
ncbi:MAG: carbohydrate ABC transporter permease [Zhenhengia sp.]|uniref:carbohydrate ABC transporter permease n=1 Tax=Zhenhengia sp. TaxID=2944208 RepID=UPI003992A89F